jgi:hypothetical protein
MTPLRLLGAVAMFACDGGGRKLWRRARDTGEELAASHASWRVAAGNGAQLEKHKLRKCTAQGKAV